MSFSKQFMLAQGNFLFVVANDLAQECPAWTNAVGQVNFNSYLPCEKN